MPKKQYPESKKAWAEKNVDKIRAYQREWARRNYEKNKEKRRASSRKYYDKNKDKLAEANKKRCSEHYYKNHEANKEKKRNNYVSNKEKILTQQKNYYEKNKNVIIKKTYERKKIKLKVDKQFALREKYRNAISSALRYRNLKKTNKTTELLGCTAEFFLQYIESLFEPWMNWNNHGVHMNDGIRKWHIDHIIPLSHFDLTDFEQAKKAFHYTNCRPYDAQKNISEGDRKS